MRPQVGRSRTGRDVSYCGRSAAAAAAVQATDRSARPRRRKLVDFGQGRRLVVGSEVTWVRTGLWGHLNEVDDDWLKI